MKLHQSWLEEVDGDVGVFWSSGLESTLLLLMCIEKYGKDRVHTFTQKFPHDDPFDRAVKHYHYFADALADEMGLCNHHTVEVGSGGLNSNEVRIDLYNAAIKLVPNIEAIYVGVNTTQVGRLIDPTQRQIVADAWDTATLIKTPFMDIKKYEAIKMFYEYGYSQWITSTRSCARSTVYHCGRCSNCTERKMGFDQAGIQDPTTYMID
jgi:hypothetical protein